MEFDDTLPQSLTAKVLCCRCGVLTDVNPSFMCPNCIKAHVDITEGFIREYILVHCPECSRYLQPPKYWIKAELESRELLTLCLKKIRGLTKYRLIDAMFIATEDHSKRLKVKLVLQQEVFTNTVIQQATLIDYVVQWRQCELCAKAATGQAQWDAVVQVRQRVLHRRTFLFLEQMILKHKMNEKVINISGHRDGLDFFFNHRSHALQFLDFVSQHAPTLRQDAQQLVSHDSKSNVAVVHHAFSLELSPLCREDLVVLPKKLYTALGAIGPFVLVHKIFSSTVFIDPQTLRITELLGTFYWKSPFESYATTRQMVEFFINDIRLTGDVNGKFQMADAEVCLADEVGQGREWCVKTHLGALLRPGDLAMGYLIDTLNPNNTEINDYIDMAKPDVILVRKHFPNQAARRHKRAWRLKRLDKSVSQALHAARQDFDEFMDDLERDKEFREGIPLYVEQNLDGKLAKDITNDRIVVQGAAAAAGGAQGGDDEEEADEAVVQLEELLDELKLGGEDAALGHVREKRARPYGDDKHDYEDGEGLA
jgi:nonsense-mediated mRNA decay protein 3